jgi:hypothetical protein
MNREQLNEYYRKKYHAEKEQRKENNLKKYGTTRSPAYIKAKARYFEKNKEKYRKIDNELHKKKYEKDNLETLTLRAVRRLFVE